MPYEIKKKRGKYVVQKKGGSKIFGRHSSSKKAKKQMAALYANTKHESIDIDAIADLITDDPDIFIEKKLTYKARKKLPKSSFALPNKRKYPIHSKSHARNALSRVSAHGSPEEKKKVRSAVERRHPDIKQSKSKRGKK